MKGKKQLALGVSRGREGKVFPLVQGTLFFFFSHREILILLTEHAEHVHRASGVGEMEKLF